MVWILRWESWGDGVNIEMGKLGGWCVDIEMGKLGDDVWILRWESWGMVCGY